MKPETTDKIRDLHCQGRTELEIREATGQSAANVRGVIRALEKEFSKRYTEDLAACKMRLINGYERIMKEAWGGWVESKLEEKVVKSKCGKCAGSGSASKGKACDQCRGMGNVVVVRVAHPGDPRMLREINQSIAGIRQLLGTDAPKKTESKVDATIEIISEEHATDEQLESIARGEFEFDEAGRAVVGGVAVALSATKQAFPN